MKHFKTERRLWFWISLGMFVAPWFLPIAGVKGSNVAPCYFWWILFAYPSHIVETLSGLALLCLMFGIPVIALGWIAQAVVVIIRQGRKHQ